MWSVTWKGATGYKHECIMATKESALALCQRELHGVAATMLPVK